MKFHLLPVKNVSRFSNGLHKRKTGRSQGSTVDFGWVELHVSALMGFQVSLELILEDEFVANLLHTAHLYNFRKLFGILVQLELGLWLLFIHGWVEAPPQEKTLSKGVSGPKYSLSLNVLRKTRQSKREGAIFLSACLISPLKNYPLWVFQGGRKCAVRAITRFPRNSKSHLSLWKESVSEVERSRECGTTAQPAIPSHFSFFAPRSEREEEEQDRQNGSNNTEGVDKVI